VTELAALTQEVLWAFFLAGLLLGVITQPHLEQIAQDEQGIGLCMGHVMGPSEEGVLIVHIEVYVRDEIRLLPGGACLDV